MTERDKHELLTDCWRCLFYQYLNRALAHHMQHALDLKLLPLTDDADAQQWCSHNETLVRAAMRANSSLPTA